MKLRLAVLATVLLSALVIVPAYGFDLSKLLSAGSAEQFKIIHVQDLAALRAKGEHLMVFDANTPDVRASEGVIPGAYLLISAGDYSLGVLPRDKSTPLVFYCHDSY